MVTLVPQHTVAVREAISTRWAELTTTAMAATPWLDLPIESAARMAGKVLYPRVNVSSSWWPVRVWHNVTTFHPSQTQMGCCQVSLVCGQNTARTNEGCNLTIYINIDDPVPIYFNVSPFISLYVGQKTIPYGPQLTDYCMRLGRVVEPHGFNAQFCSYSFLPRTLWKRWEARK